MEFKAFTNQSSRNRSSNRCPKCGINIFLCFCDLIPKLELSTSVIILMHWRERLLPSNTAQIAHLALINSEIHLRGMKENPLDPSQLLREDYSGALLYPAEDAEVLSLEILKKFKKPIQLFVPDGSWRQARKVATREKGLFHLPRFSLPPGKPSEYRLRYSPHEKNLSTFEAIARALGILEGAEVQESLEHLFAIMIERTLWSRGELSTSQCKFKIPEAAIEASYIAGARGSSKT